MKQLNTLRSADRRKERYVKKKEKAKKKRKKYLSNPIKRVEKV